MIALRSSKLTTDTAAGAFIHSVAFRTLLHCATDNPDRVQLLGYNTAFDDVPDYRNAGIRLNYESITEPMEGLRDRVLLEAGFDRIGSDVGRPGAERHLLIH